MSARSGIRFWSMLGNSGGGMRKTIVVCMLVALLCASSSPADELPASPKVQIILALKSSVVCLKSPHLQADLLLVNRGDESYVFDVNDLNVITGYSTVSTSAHSRSAGMSTMYDRIGPKPKPALVSVTPNGAYSQSLSFSLKDSFFAAPGFYRLMPNISIGKLRKPVDLATAIIFEVRDCEN